MRKTSGTVIIIKQMVIFLHKTGVVFCGKLIVWLCNETIKHEHNRHRCLHNDEVKVVVLILVTLTMEDDNMQINEKTRAVFDVHWNLRTSSRH